MYVQTGQTSRVPWVALLRLLASSALGLLLSASILGSLAVSKVEAPADLIVGEAPSALASLPMPSITSVEQAAGEAASASGVVPFPPVTPAELAVQEGASDGASLPAAPLAGSQATTSTTYLPLVSCSRCGLGGSGWPMAGANPQRTSWVPEQVPSADYLAQHRTGWNNGMLYLQWAQPIQPYISHKVQVIAANNTLYISTAAGLYALYSGTGTVKWVYPTELPLGNSPTIYKTANGKYVAYVGGLDHKIHAIDANTGVGLWTYEASQGFETNPLVVNGILYAGNRDGYMYAIHVENGAGFARGDLAWPPYKTGGPILFSAAYQNGVVYFASNDDYAYALNATTGALVWKSAKFPGAGFHSWWPVVYGDVVIFAGSSNYRDHVRPGTPCNCNIDQLDRLDVFSGFTTRGQPVGARQGLTEWINAWPRITEYFEQKPWRRTYFVLDRATGQEVTYNFDGDNKPDYAPILWQGSQSGNRYPPIVGGDDILYQTNDFMYAPWINGGGLSGWRIGTPYISTPAAFWHAVDEPLAYSAGGNLVYWVYHDDVAAGGFDTSVPNRKFWDAAGQDGPGLDATREWVYWDYDLSRKLPDYDQAMGGYAFGGQNGVYQRNGDQNPMVPYNGMVYVIRGNAVLALVGEVDTAPSVQLLPMAQTVTTTVSSPAVNRTALRQTLADEVQKIVSAGHLRPGYLSSGHVDNQLILTCGDNMQDYFHDPSETLYALLQAIPHLTDPTLLQNTKDYIQTEFNDYKPYQVNHIGWATGAAREVFDLPPDILGDAASMPASGAAGWDFPGWGGAYGGTGIPPHIFYALWKYAEVFPDEARAIFDASKGALSREPGDTVLAQYPFVHNSFIAGYVGYLNLRALAGYSPQDAEAVAIRDKLNRLYTLRKGTFLKDNPYTEDSLCRVLSVSRNFLFLVPELADVLYADPAARGKVQTALDEYYRIEPYWFVSAFEDTYGEAIIQPLYDVNALFQARALILKQPASTLVKYLDVPAFQRGDLFYIQNLVAVLNAPDPPP